MKAFFDDIFEYTHHANALLIEVILRNPEIYSETICLLFSHILNAHHIWNHRILGVAPTRSVWQPLEMQNLQDLNDANKKHSMAIIQKKDFSEKISYSNSKGFHYTNTVHEIVFHIINHSTYHRGQVVTQLKLMGIEPVVTDYIFYKR